eukprot:TRINITY_DN53436_c0_g1_i1.p1 TRINITY_DN53436_c0_g1~~TRINITY_DN53436_c0_g1_i1.p1  ORF type:complete len:187 (-),score=47.53 TRINITY_DN53436_c0_g1_i1:4-564(-)
MGGLVGERCFCGLWFFFFQAEDGIRDVERSRGLGDVYKRQGINAEYMGYQYMDIGGSKMDDIYDSKTNKTSGYFEKVISNFSVSSSREFPDYFSCATKISPQIQADKEMAKFKEKDTDVQKEIAEYLSKICLLYTSDAADDTPCVDLGGRRIIQKKTQLTYVVRRCTAVGASVSGRAEPSTDLARR